MKSLKLHLFVIGCLLAGMGSHAWSSEPTLLYDVPTTSAISSAAQANSYALSANANDVLNFTVVATTSTSGAFGPCILLYSSAGTLLDSAGGFYRTDVEMNGYKIPASGTYNVLIKDCADTATGNYAISLQKTNNPINSVPIVYGQVQTGNTGSTAQSNAYTLIGTMNDVLSFTVVSTKSTSGAFGPCIQLYSSAGTLLDSAGGFYSTDVEMNGYKIPASGTYNVLIKDCADTATGNYTLATQCLGACLLPAPVLTSMSPASALAGSNGFTLTVKGSNFVNVESNSVVEWNDSERSTTFVSTTELKAAIPATDLRIPGSYPVRVFTPAPGGGYSKDLIFIVLGPVITKLTPTSVIAGGPAFTLTVNGSNLLNGSVVKWNGNPLPTTYKINTPLQAAVSATDIATAGVFSITVTNSLGPSAPVLFTVDNPVPVLTKLSPARIIVGGSGFPLTLTGSGFVKGSMVRWSGTPLATTYLSPTTLKASIPTIDILDGNIPVTVYNSKPGGGLSNPITFPIDNPVPVIISLSPASVKHGGGSFILTVNGFDFNEGAKVQWNGSALPTTFVSDAQLTAKVPASAIVTSGSATVTVANPAPTLSASNPLKFTIN